MAHSRSAIKRGRQSESRRAHNKPIKSALKSQIKKVRTLVSEKNFASAEKELLTVQKMLDKAAKTHLLHTNKASRLKSRLKIAINKIKPAPAGK
ncbi:MAG: 30S ribosomal protein S20 [Planctomycetes bacterium]|nr:30S ribosomal protein S20 [Planctomycetota bacterium]